MSNTQERAVSVAAATSSAGQYGSVVQRRQLALERYLAAIAGDKPSHLHAAAADDRHRVVDENGTPAVHPTVSTIMTAAISLPTTAGFADVLRALAANAVSAIPVVDEAGVPVGVVSEADLLVHVADDDVQAHSRWHRASHAVHRRTPGELTAVDLMSSPAITTTPEASITQAATIAAHAHVKALPVVDAEGRVVGMLSRSVLLGAYLAEAQ